MLVYRLEHEIGCGPYHCDKLKQSLPFYRFNDLNELSQELCDKHSGSVNHPVPDYFSVNGKSCACESLDKLCEWFDGFLEKFARFGYYIAVYDAPNVNCDFNQVIFHKDYAELVETISIL